MTMAHRDSASIKSQGLSLVITSIVVLVVVAWMLLSFLGGALAEVKCQTEIPDDPMEECDDHDRDTPND
jgi:hypothetical protein